MRPAIPAAAALLAGPRRLADRRHADCHHHRLLPGRELNNPPQTDRKGQADMRNTLVATALLLAAALPAAAQSTQVTTTWSGANLIVQGGTLSGCNIRVLEAAHTGSTVSAIRITFVNNGTRTARVNGDTTLSGNGQSKTGAFRSVAMAAGIGAVSQGMGPFAGVLAGTTLTVNITSCTQQ